MNHLTVGDIRGLTGLIGTGAEDEAIAQLEQLSRDPEFYAVASSARDDIRRQIKGIDENLRRAGATGADATDLEKRKVEIEAELAVLDGLLGKTVRRRAAIVPEPAPDAQGVFRQLPGAGPGVASISSTDGAQGQTRLEVVCGDCQALLMEGFDGDTPALDLLNEHSATFIMQCWRCRAFNNVSDLQPAA
jgi:hypothetical protein